MSHAGRKDATDAGMRAGRGALHIVILLAAALVVYAAGDLAGLRFLSGGGQSPPAGALSSDFAFDDIHLIVRNDRLDRLGGALDGFTSDYYASSERAATGETRALGYYRPLAVLLNWLDRTIWGRRAFGFHLTNLLLHLGAVVSFYSLAVRLLRRRDSAFAAALLFAVHPVHPESVTFISGRVDLLAGLFYILSLLHLAKSWTSGAPARNRRLSLLFFFGAMLSKEMAITLPAAVFILEGLLAPPNPRPWRAAVRRAVPYVALLAVYLAVRFAVLGSLSPRAGSTGGFAETWIRSSTVLITYLGLLLWPPFRFNVEPPVALPGAVDGRVILATAVLAGVAGLGVWLAARRRWPPLAAGILWTLATLVPVAQIVRVETLVGERFLYIPSVGACLVLGWLLFRPASLRAGVRARAAAAAWVMLGAVTIAYGANTIHRNTFWRDNLRFWTAKVGLSPGSAEAHSALAIEHSVRGDIDPAIREYELSLQLDPNHLEALNNYAVILLRKGDASAARKVAQRAVQRAPNSASARNTLANCLHAAGAFTQAAPQYRRALQLDPAFREAWINLGNTYLAAGSPDSAVRAYGEAVRLRRDEGLIFHVARCYALDGRVDDGMSYLARQGIAAPGTARFLLLRGNLESEAGLIDAAVASLRAATRGDPGLVDAWVELGRVLAAARRGVEAKQAFESALALDPKLSVAHNNLGALAEESGDLAAAVEHYERATILAPGDPVVLRNLGGAYARIGQPSRAIEVLDRALRQGPDPLAHYFRALAWKASGQPGRAIDDCRRAITLNPGFADAYHVLGEIRSAAGETAEANAEFQKFLRLAPPDDPRRAAVERRLAGENSRR
jgi:tetratricopeptide (TPR) repeat protein